MRILSELVRDLPIASREGDPRALGPTVEAWPEERQAVERAVSKRQNEYFATRHLARQALAAFDVPAVAILNHPDRSPRWPEGIMGSLTHTDSWCGVAVARTGGEIVGLGIDMERLNSVSPEVARRILSERERHLATDVEVALRFSAKEAFYKAIYARVQRYVGFAEVEIDLAPGERRFHVHLVSEALAAEIDPSRITGSYAMEAGLGCTVVVVR